MSKNLDNIIPIFIFPPEPIVDHKKERLNTLAVYKKYIN